MGSTSRGEENRMTPRRHRGTERMCSFLLRASVPPWFILLVATVGPADARINVVTLPGRDSVQLTIYNSADLTLVKETRLLTLRKGLNRLEFSWANTLIDPTSAELRPIDHADAVDIIDVSFPAGIANTLEWRIQSEITGEVAIEIRYFTSGIRWGADYVVEAAPTEKSMRLMGHVRVINNSGEDYENAQIRLVVRVVRLVEDIAQLARRGLSRRSESEVRLNEWQEADGDLRQKAQRELKERLYDYEKLGRNRKDIVKEGLSEYFLYTVEGRDTIPNGWAKRLPSFNAADVPIISFYRYEREITGDNVIRSYRFTNSVSGRLGTEPLPDGSVKAFRLAQQDGTYAFVGSTSVKYIPVNEQVDLDLGNDREVLVKPTLMNWQKDDLRFDRRGNVVGWTTRETWQFELQNSKPIDARLDLRRNFSGDWTLETRQSYEKLAPNKVKFLLPLRSGEKQPLAYILTTRHGTSARR